MTAHFIGDLEVRLLNDASNEGRGSWELLKDLGFWSEKFQATYVTKAGTTTDFASVPRLPLVWLIAGDRGHMAATIHDGLYQSHATDRETADRVLEEALICEGFSPEEAEAWYLGVHYGGQSHWDEKTAPIGVGTSAGPQLPLGNLA